MKDMKIFFFVYLILTILALCESYPLVGNTNTYPQHQRLHSNSNSKYIRLRLRPSPRSSTDIFPGPTDKSYTPTDLISHSCSRLHSTDLDDIANPNPNPNPSIDETLTPTPTPFTIEDFAPFKEYFSELQVSDIQWSKLVSLCDEIRSWNSKVNLISRKDIDRLIPNHVIPSMSIALVKQFDPKGRVRVIDVGCGGGFPGLPMAILFPETSFTLLDSNGKKMMIVEDIAQTLALKNVEVVNMRAEDFTPGPREQFDFIMGRAVSALPNFLGFSSHLIRPPSLSTSTSTSNPDPNPDPSSNEDEEQGLSNGLLYLKGGEFKEEVEAESGICTYALHPVRGMVPPLETDKKVLYVPYDEIHKFHYKKLVNEEKDRSDREKQKLEKNKTKSKGQGQGSRGSGQGGRGSGGSSQGRGRGRGQTKKITKSWTPTPTPKDGP